MKYEIIRVQREKEFSEELRQLFNADVIEGIIREGEVEGRENYLLAAMHGHGLKITEGLAPRVHAICEQVKAALEFTEPVEFFVHGDSSLNCVAAPRTRDDQPHLVIINSGLLERFTDAELRFVLGHELGHLISRNSELSRVIRFVFADDEQIPLSIRDKIELWGKCSEMSADRFGYLAEPDLDVCLAVFFKLSSGLDTAAIRFDAAAYSREMDRVLEAFRTEMSDTGASHPINPLRLQALKLFAGSHLCTDLLEGREGGADTDLDAAMEELVQVLLTKGHSALVQARRRFIAAAGLLVAGLDEQLDEAEVDAILEPLAGFTHFPAEYFRRVLEERDVLKVFHESARAILEANPGERFSMFRFMVAVALADRMLDQREVEMLFEVGETMFGFQRKEIAQLLAEALQKEFVPRITLA
ncbi:M48 family metalloprotease [bacterium]|nr:M48 family metalloprotease [bacterium]